jgi:hypothetical protein
VGRHDIQEGKGSDHGAHIMRRRCAGVQPFRAGCILFALKPNGDLLYYSWSGLPDSGNYSNGSAETFISESRTWRTYFVDEHYVEREPPTPAPSRYDIAPDPPDHVIDVIGDIVRIAGLFAQGCS